MKILHLDDNKRWVPVEKRYYNDEAHLQNLLAEDVNILPFDEIGYETPFVTIGKEIGLANGSLDLLAVSPQGHIALIETKLDKNPEVKRTVVGQILGYAAYLWNESYNDLEATYKKYLSQQKIKFEGSLFEYISSKAGSGLTETEFREGIEKRLRLGSFSLLIVVDQVNQELQDIANYLNDRTGQGVDFYVMQMEMIGDKSESFLIPRLANPPRKNIAYGQSKTSDNYDRTPISKEEFLQKLSIPGQKLANRLLREFENHPDIDLIWRKNGFTLATAVPKDYIKPGYLSNFSYLFFKSSNTDNVEADELQFGFPDWAYENMPEINPSIKDYVNFYRSLKGFDEKKNIQDLSIFDNQTTEKFIELIKNTAKKLSQKQEV